MDQDDTMTLTFRCPPEHADLLPRPIPAVQGLPGWFKAMPQRAFNAISQSDGQTVKKCPPFIDAMTYGFLIPLACDLHVNDGEFTWDFNLPSNKIDNFVRSPIAFHDSSQIAGTPYFQEDRFAIKFNNFWSIEAPPGYSVLFTHPVNRPDLPFTTLTGLVDCDTYHDSLINFPAHWHDMNFNGVLPKGTPVVQCIPMKRDSWQAQFEVLSDDDADKLRAISRAISNEEGIYRHRFRASKR
ncbi:MAG: hypothetical protein AB7O50_12565 [Pseudolabrys sp.]